VWCVLNRLSDANFDAKFKKTLYKKTKFENRARTFQNDNGPGPVKIDNGPAPSTTDNGTGSTKTYHGPGPTKTAKMQHFRFFFDI
jgi:hypothetical protein